MPYVFSFRTVFSYLVTTGWVFDISLRGKKTNKNQSTNSTADIMVHMYVLLYSYTVVGHLY